MIINITLTNAIGFPGLSQNNPSNPMIQDVLPSIFEYGNEFSIDANFSYAGTSEYIDILLDYKSVATNLSAESELSVNQLGPKTIRIKGKAIDIFIDAFYRFLMPDNTLKVLPANTQESFLALVEYSPPGLKRRTVSHTVNLDITYIPNPNPPTEEGGSTPTVAQQVTINRDIVFTQDVVWNYDIAVTQFQNLLAKGVI